MAESRLEIIPKPLRGEDGYKTFSIRIPLETFARIDKLHQLSCRSRNELIGTLLEFALDHSDIGKRRHY